MSKIVRERLESQEWSNEMSERRNDANLNPDWESLDLPQGVLCEYLGLAYQKLENEMLADTASDEAREIAQNAYVFGMRVLYTFLRRMREGETSQFPFEVMFEQIGRELSLRAADTDSH